MSGQNRRALPMTANEVSLCLHHLEAAESLLLGAGEWVGAAHLSLVIERLRGSIGRAERSLASAEFADRGRPDEAAH
jgi:hypothetical protein